MLFKWTLLTCTTEDQLVCETAAYSRMGPSLNIQLTLNWVGTLSHWIVSICPTLLKTVLGVTFVLSITAQESMKKKMNQQFIILTYTITNLVNPQHACARDRNGMKIQVGITSTLFKHFKSQCVFWIAICHACFNAYIVKHLNWEHLGPGQAFCSQIWGCFCCLSELVINSLSFRGGKWKIH